MWGWLWFFDDKIRDKFIICENKVLIVDDSFSSIYMLVMFIICNIIWISYVRCC